MLWQLSKRLHMQRRCPRQVQLVLPVAFGANVSMAMATSTGVLAPMNGIVYLQNATNPSMQGWQNSTFGQGTQIGTTGWYCVYNGLGSGLGGGGVQVAGLQPGTTYRVMVVSDNGYYTGLPTYHTATTSSNPATWPIPKPTVQASSVAAY